MKLTFIGAGGARTPLVIQSILNYQDRTPVREIFLMDTDAERLERIYYFVRELPYDILAAFRYLADGRRRASDVLHAGTAFCMGKASSFVALCWAAGIPARVGFQQIHCPDKPFMSEEVRRLWGDRTLPWHSLGEAWLNGRWLKLDATIDSATAAAKGRPYAREFDGRHDIPTVEGPIVNELGSYADYPRDVAEWYEAVAREVLEETAHRFVVFRIEKPTPEMVELAKIIQSCCLHIEQAIRLLRNMRHASAIQKHLKDVGKLENEADKIYRETESALFADPPDILMLIKWRELYGRLEETVDACKRVTQVISEIVIKGS